MHFMTIINEGKKMNEIFIIGKVVSKIEYKFIINSKKHFAKVELEIELNRWDENGKMTINHFVVYFCYIGMIIFLLLLKRSSSSYLDENRGVWVSTLDT